MSQAIEMCGPKDGFKCDTKKMPQIEALLYLIAVVKNKQTNI